MCMEQTQAQMLERLQMQKLSQERIKRELAFIMTVFYHHRMITALTMITAIHHHQVNLRQLSLDYIRWITVNMFPLAAKLVMTPTVPRIIAKVQVMLKQKCEACIIAF